MTAPHVSCNVLENNSTRCSFGGNLKKEQLTMTPSSCDLCTPNRLAVSWPRLVCYVGGILLVAAAFIALAAPSAQAQGNDPEVLIGVAIDASGPGSSGAVAVVDERIPGVVFDLYLADSLPEISAGSFESTFVTTNTVGSVGVGPDAGTGVLLSRSGSDDAVVACMDPSAGFSFDRVSLNNFGVAADPAGEGRECRGAHLDGNQTLGFYPWVFMVTRNVPEGIVAVTPCAIADTRFGSGSYAGLRSGGSVTTILAAGSIPSDQGGAGCAPVPAGVTTVMANVVAVSPAANGNLKASATGVVAQGGVVNFTAGQNNSNAIPIKLNSNGQLDITVNGPAGPTTHIRVVILGYYTPTGGEGIVAVTPCAIVDTRFGNGAFSGRRSGGSVTTVQAAGAIPGSQGGAGCAPVPAGVTTVMANVIAVNPVANGNLKASAAGVAAQGGVVNFTSGLSNANAVPVKLDSSGRLDIGVNGPGAPTTHIRIVILGYYTPNGGEGMVAITPCAIADTRFGSGGFAGLRSGGSVMTLKATGSIPTEQGGAGCERVPDGTTTVMANIVAVNPVANGNLKASAAGVVAQGGVVNFATGQNNSNAVPIQLDSLGRLDIGVNGPASPAIHIRIVILGYYG